MNLESFLLGLAVGFMVAFRILCWLRLHDWEYYRVHAGSRLIGILAACRRCGKEEWIIKLGEEEMRK
ncbi:MULTISPECIES: hypothetical protein [unclassified Archaeoglobus]|jgi:hypothetical protein|uniref:hypothetical protein n=1 Tax=unclassified Archaeoglobus TaxID=2643606 RepID=UPI0025C2B8FC|nr:MULTISPECIES: hypothetical protein [unclassified Archaeoglobus]